MRPWKGWVVTLSMRSLALPADPLSVRLARSWVGEVLTEVGRPELVPSAQLGVSELVTNAIIHAGPPLTVAVTGPVEHPRIEVTDHGAGELRVNLAMGDDDFPATFGRGLTLVATVAARWGSEPGPDGFGKRVWFEPAVEMLDDLRRSVPYHPSDNQVFRDNGVQPVGAVTIVLGNFPARMFAQLRRYHMELRRELRLLTLSDPDRYPIAVTGTQLFARIDAERRMTSGVGRLDDAIARGLATVDLEYAVPPGAPATMGEAYAFLQECYRWFADEHLLAINPPEPLRRLQGWYFGEFVRQGDGEPPTAWTGEVELMDTSVG